MVFYYFHYTEWTYISSWVSSWVMVHHGFCWLGPLLWVAFRIWGLGPLPRGLSLSPLTQVLMGTCYNMYIC